MRDSLPVLIVDDQPEALQIAKTVLRHAGIANIVCCQQAAEVQQLLASQEFGVVMLDLSMPVISGEELLSVIAQEYPALPVIILTGMNDVHTAVRCMKAGAADYMVKPVESSRLVSGVRRALELRELQLENQRLTAVMQSHTLENPDAFQGFITQNSNMLAVLRYVETIAKTQKPALITGETGVGKELVANAIHTIGGRRGKFVAVNVAGIDDTAVSDTLFGHVKGAFTGAQESREGLIERANGGTLFMDEIGDLGPAAQIKLLRLLQEQEYLPLGSDVPRRANVRIVAATHRDLERMQADGSFRKDLYYRIITHHIRIPPLRERLDDLPKLLNHFIALAAQALDKSAPTAPRELVPTLATYHFPGNVRELEAMVFEAVSQHERGVLSMNAFTSRIGSRRSVLAGVAPNAETTSDAPLAINGQFPTLKQTAEWLVGEALRRAKGSQANAARLLGITPAALSKRLSRGRKGDDDE